MPSTWQYEEFKRQLPDWSPESELDTPRGIAEVDQRRREVGAQPTAMGAAIENTYIRPNLFASDPNAADNAPRGTDMSLFPSQDEAMGAARGAGYTPETRWQRVMRLALNPLNSAPATAQYNAWQTRTSANDAQLKAEHPFLHKVAQEIPTVAGVNDAQFFGAANAAGKALSASGAAEDALQGWQKILSGTRARMREAGISARDIKNASNDLEAANRAIRSGAQNPTISATTRSMLERAGLQDFADRFGQVEIGTSRGAQSVTAGAGEVPPPPPRTPIWQGAAGGGEPPPLPPTTAPGPVRQITDAHNQIFIDAERAANEAAIAAQQTPVIGRHIPVYEGTGAGPSSRPGFHPQPGEAGTALPPTPAPRIPAEQMLDDGLGAAQADRRAWLNLDPGQRADLEAQRAAGVRARAAANAVITASGEKPEPTGIGKIGQVASAILRGAQRMMLGAEVSAITRQGRRLAAGHPLDTTKAWVKGLPQLFRSPEVAGAVNDTVTGGFWGNLFQTGGGSFRSLDDTNVAARDIFSSQFPANLADTHIPIPVVGSAVRGVGNIYRGTEQATVIGLNAQARNVFETLVRNNWDRIAPGLKLDDVEALGQAPASALNMDELKKITDLIMLAQGRSTWLEKNAAEYLPALNATLLAPQWRITRLQQAAIDLNAVRDLGIGALRGRVDPLSKEIAKNAVGYYASGAAIMTLMAGAGAKVGLNPFASNWGRIEFGPVSYDIWAGDAGWSRALAQSLAQRQDTRSGDTRNVAWTKPILDWMRGGSGLAFGMGLDYVTGETVTGQKFNLKDAAWQRITNIYGQDVVSALDAEVGVSSNPLAGGLKGAAQSVGQGFIGIGVNRTQSAAQQKANAAVPGGDFNKASVDEQRAALENTPGLKDALEADRSNAGGITGQVNKIRSDYTTRQQVFDAQLAAGDMNKKDWYKSSQDTQHEMDAVIAAKYREYGAQALSPQAQPGEQPDKWYLRVIAANSDPTDKTGRTVNWNAVERWRASLTPEQDKYIDEHMGKRALTPEDEKRLQFNREMRMSGFYKIQDAAWSKLSAYPGVSGQNASEYEDKVVAAALAKMPPDATDTAKERVAALVASKDPVLKAYHEIANKQEMPWIAQHPELANKAVGYGVFRPTVGQTAFIGIKLNQPKP